jgi:hypothetical protein
MVEAVGQLPTPVLATVLCAHIELHCHLCTGLPRGYHLLQAGIELVDPVTPLPHTVDEVLDPLATILFRGALEDVEVVLLLAEAIRRVAHSTLHFSLLGHCGSGKFAHVEAPCTVLQGCHTLSSFGVELLTMLSASSDGLNQLFHGQGSET